MGRGLPAIIIICVRPLDLSQTCVAPGLILSHPIIRKSRRKKVSSKFRINLVCCDFFFPQVKDLDCEGLFGNIESVLKTSQKLLTSLENAVDDTKGNDQELGNVLIACLWMLNFAMV